MDPDEIESAYGEFTAVLRSHELPEPVEGWSAEMIGAHVALNNDEIANVAERVARGESTTYDNSAGVDEFALRAFIERVGGRDGVAEAVASSARRLAQARRQLSDEAAQVTVPVVIYDHGQLVVDEPFAIGDFIEGNATFHLELHLEQLRALSR